MGIMHKPDGRWLVGMGVESGNEYAGSMGYRDIVIQLTASGATDKSMEYLAFLQDYALSHYAVGEAIVPPNVSVYISTNGYIKAVQADDYSTDGTNFEVGGIKWNGSAWDFSNAGQGSGGGGGGSANVLVVNLASDGNVVSMDKTWQEMYDTLENGGALFFVQKRNGEYFSFDLTNIAGSGGYYAVYLWNIASSSEWEFGTNSANGYPETSA